MIRRIKVTEKQKRAVNNILSGHFKTRAEAMRQAGYAKTTSHRLSEKLLKSKGVESYIKSLDVISQQQWGLNLPTKVALTFLDGLSAEKPYGRNAELFPDWQARLSYLDRFAEFFGWVNRSPAHAGRLKKQPIFFETPEEEKTAYNEEFKKFLASYYSGKNGDKA